MEVYLNHTSSSHTTIVPNGAPDTAQQPKWVKGCWILSHGRHTFWLCSRCGFIIDSSTSAISCPACITRPLFEVLKD